MIKFIVDTHFINLIFQKTREIITEKEIKDNLWQQLFYWLNQDNVINAEYLLNDMEQMFINDINNFHLAKGKLHLLKKEYYQSAEHAKMILYIANNNNLLTQALNTLAKDIELLKQTSDEYSSLLYTSYIINPYNPDTLIALGNYFISSKKYDKAKECYDKLEKVNPQHPFLNKNNALLFECKRDYEKSLEYFLKYEKQIESQKDINEIKYTYSKIIDCARRLEKAYLALKYAKRLVKMETSASSLFMLANCYNMFNKQEKTQKYCEKALEQAKDCNTRETIRFSLNISKIDQNKLDIANFDTKLYSYHSVMNLWGLYERKNKKQKDDFQRVFNIVIKNAYEHHNANDNSEKPKIFYKYVKCNKKRIKEILEKEYLYLSALENFNDPFDPPIKRAKNYDEVKELLGDMRIGCISGSWDNVLMWSHYADSHKGLCIGYDASDIFKQGFTKQNTILRKCIYTDDAYLDSLSLEIPIINNRDLEAFKNNIFNQLSFLDAYSIKHKNWEYEKEWRIITHNTENKIILPIREICFGLGMNEDKKRLIKKYIQKLNKNHIGLWNLSSSNHLYCLQREKYSLSI